jgi:hypothetical protein
MNELGYFLTVMVSLSLLGLASYLVLQAIEGIYWIYCKIKKIDY